MNDDFPIIKFAACRNRHADYY